MTRILRSNGTLAWLVVCGLGLAPLAAADGVGPSQGDFYVIPGLSVYKAPDSEGHEAGAGIAFGYMFAERWGVELLYSKVDADYDTPFGNLDADVELYWADLLYKFGGSERWQPFALLGGGRTDIESFDDTQLNAGIGVFRKLDSRWSLRGDVRLVHSEEEGDVEPFVFVGLSVAIGARPKAPPPDTDGDGVPDPNDRCPGTPPGRTVDASGCEFDTDRDGVVDDDDACPDTPLGAPVDVRGCTLDTDGDGVPDFSDECPDTERGARVDEKGCYLELEETVTIDLNLEFDVNSSQLRPDHYAEIQRVVEFLREYPTANAVIEGHTDSDGSAEYNQALSERRARSVMNDLIERTGVRRDRLSYAGFGESRPVAGNDTAGGKQRNRRVSAVVSGTQTVRQ